MKFVGRMHRVRIVSAPRHLLLQSFVTEPNTKVFILPFVFP
jgi:hypothetical protein